MTAAPNDVAEKNLAEQSAEQQAAVELVRMAEAQSMSLTGPDGLLKQLTKTVLETTLSEEITEHLEYGRRSLPGVDVRRSWRDLCCGPRRESRTRAASQVAVHWS